MIGRIPITDVQPAVDGAQRPARAVTGESFEVSATVFGIGHETIGAGAVLSRPDGTRCPPVAMREIAEGTDRWAAEVTVTAEGLWQFEVQAWADPVARWLHDAAIKLPLGQDPELTLADGAVLFERAARQAASGQRPQGGPPADAAAARAAAAALTALATTLTDTSRPPDERLAAARSEQITVILAAWPLRERLSRSARYPVAVHRERALYGAWYEFFPRSEGATAGDGQGDPPRSGTLTSAAGRLDAIAAMGFDVVYIPPVHPVGTTARKGPNNSLTAGPHDPGSPWAIGSPAGGHDAIHPDLGTLADFDAFVARARQAGLEVAMDLAIQTSPDHPWASEHPEWFTRRADGSIAYAENPPKKYQDIYPVNFDNDPDGIHAEILRTVRHWMSHGIRIFRVDNPHTKPLSFWERLLAEVAATDPDVIFLAEAFTRPAMMHTLAKIGFHQSYTYFTWRTSAGELTEYLRELSGPAAAYMRPNFFVNTPDILHDYLVHGGPPAFAVRAVLAAMLSPAWGMYSGYELCENVPIVPGSEEYLDSEKYQYRPRIWVPGPGAGQQPPRHDISPLITALNQIRRAHPALHRLRNLRFHYSDSTELICFSKTTRPGAVSPGPLPPGPLPPGPLPPGPLPPGTAAPGTDSPGTVTAAADDTVLVIVNLDPHQPREATVWLDVPALGYATGTELTCTDELTGASYRWGQANYVRLDPAMAPAHIFTVTAASG